MPYPGLLHPEPLPPAAGHCSPVPSQETLKHSSGSVSVGSLGPSVHKAFLSPLSISANKGFDSKHNFTSPTILWCYSFALGCGYLFLVVSNILQVVQQQVVVLEFSQEKMSARPSTLPSYATRFFSIAH